MGSPDRLFNRQRTVHQILGGGFVADVILWRQKNVTAGVLLVTLAVWVMFERSGYTLLSLLSSVLLLLIVVLYLWAKSAALLNRPSPPLPELYLSEESANEMAAFACTRLNSFLAVSHDLLMGKDSRLFTRVASCLFFISVIGSLLDFLTLGYISLVIVLTIPSFYEKYEDHIDKHLIASYRKLHHLYVQLDAETVEHVSNVEKWILEMRKLN